MYIVRELEKAGSNIKAGGKRVICPIMSTAAHRTYCVSTCAFYTEEDVDGTIKPKCRLVPDESIGEISKVQPK